MVIAYLLSYSIEKFCRDEVDKSGIYKLLNS